MGKEESPLEGKVHRSLYLGLPGAILSCGLNYNASIAACCSSNNKISIWDVNAGRCVGSLDKHTAEVTSCSFGKDLLASGSRDGCIYLWKYKDLKTASSIKVHSGAINACCISPDGQYLASASEDKSIRIFTIKAGSGAFIHGPVNKELLGHKEGINDVDFSNDSCALVSASSDNTIRLWDTVSGEELVVLESAKGKVTKAKFSADCNYVVSLTRKCVTVWNIGKRNISWEVENDNGFQSIACNPLQNTFIAVCINGSFSTYNVHGDCEIAEKASGHRGPVLSCSFAGNGGMVVTGGVDGKVLVWV